MSLFGASPARPGAFAPEFAASAPGIGPAANIETTSLAPLLTPRSVAIVGASGTPGKIGAIPVAMLREYGFPGAVFPVNPKAEEISGYRAVPDIAAIPEPVDLAIVAIPAAGVLHALEACAARGTRAAVVFSSGFAEIGADGLAAQAAMADLARRTGMRILGPNTLGIANIDAGLVASFCPFFRPRFPTGGAIGLVSQSGAFGGYVANLAQDRGLSFSCWITTGNEVDVDVADGIAYLAEDPRTRVILVYMEGARSGPRLIAALEQARAAGKPVIALKVGRTAIGAEAAASHTASLAGSDAVYDAVLAQYGAYRARSVAEWFELGYAYAVGRSPKNKTIGLITVSGGVGVMMADEAVSGGLDPAPLGPEAQDRIRAIVPFAGTRNPVDVTGQMIGDLGRFAEMVEVVLAEHDYGSIVCFNAGAGHTDESGLRIQKVWQQVRDRHPDVYIAISGAVTPAVRRAYEACGCLVFTEPDSAVRTAAIMARLSTSPDLRAPPPAMAQLPLPDTVLDERGALRLLGMAGLPVPEARAAADPEAAVQAAREIGFPVVVKILSPDILHKTDMGGVALDLHSEQAVRDAAARILAAGRAHAPDARIEGCLVAPMIDTRDGVETILGVQVDPIFGPIVMFGLGGILVELLQDVALRRAPFGPAEAIDMIRQIRGAALLDGVRGRPPADLEALAQALSDLSRFAAAHADRIESLDINPFLVRPRGAGAIALDAVLTLRAGDPS
ncbi:acetate--CoA ligase family protein [Aquabacter spiritensis]|uniref:Acyl-CoA synthetase (NDP forming) n=1 Tax=Aquabacter spiritensis TaxID=933073 RepID=A0A4R3LXW6_9HYPH|nr:acetate--CoA ligase family protein [Aquabacter spiritensis]TCT05472.1 acyl-CoA synthetase (NDP forming) [Aquabacter spiritensis]